MEIFLPETLCLAFVFIWIVMGFPYEQAKQSAIQAKKRREAFKKAKKVEKEAIERIKKKFCPNCRVRYAGNEVKCLHCSAPRVI